MREISRDLVIRALTNGAVVEFCNLWVREDAGKAWGTDSTYVLQSRLIKNVHFESSFDFWILPDPCPCNF